VIKDAIGNRNEVLSLASKKFREASMNGKRSRTLAHFEASDTGSERFDHPGDLHNRARTVSSERTGNFRPT
jgi:hypothetical protein